MNKAKAAVDNFLARDGKHDTTVHEVGRLLSIQGTLLTSYTGYQPCSAT
jgi:hypothetical protein